MELDRVLHVFNVRPPCSSQPPLSFRLQTELAISTRVVASDIRCDFVNTHAIVSDVHRDVSDPHAIASDIGHHELLNFLERLRVLEPPQW